MTSSYKGISVQKAGERFGLTTEDLEELFNMRENGEEGGDEFGLPLSQVKVTEKGRGGSLGYKAPRTPTAFKTFGDVGGGGGASAVATGGSFGNINVGKPKEQAAPPLKQYFGTVGGVGVRDIGQQGFGLKDYNAAIDAGYDPESIKSWVQENKGNLYNIGPGAQEKLGITGYVSTAPGVFDYAQYGQAGFGMEDVKALRAKGVAEEAIRRLAEQAPRVGPEAASQLSYTPSSSQLQNAVQAASPAPSSGGSSSFANFDYGAAGQAGFGMEDVKALAGRASVDQMREIALRAPGGQIGPEARKFLGL